MKRHRAHLLGGVFLTLGLLAGVAASGQAAEPAAGQASAQDSNGWAMYGHGNDNTRFSPLAQIDTQTGKQVWKTWTVPGPSEPGNETWKGDSWQHGVGAAWLVRSYDPSTNLVFYGTSNPSPWNSIVRSTGNDNYGKLSNLYTASTVAFDADTGKIKWHYQGTPEDAWDYDGVNELVLADLNMNGGTLTTAGGLTFYGNLHGMFKALDAKTGAQLWQMGLGSGIGAGPISYSVDGKQYVAIVVGRTASIPAFLGDVGKQMVAATPEGGALFVFTE